MLDGISIWQLLIILLIVVLVFGTKRLRNIGSDMGSALRSFRSAFNAQDEKAKEEEEEPEADRSEPEQLTGARSTAQETTGDESADKETAREGRGEH